MKAITREEKIISGENLTPITRKEMFLAKAAGQNVQTPTPITREEMFLSKITGGGGSTNHPQAYTVSSVDELPSNAVDGSMAIVPSDSIEGEWEWHETLDITLDGTFEVGVRYTANYADESQIYRPVSNYGIGLIFFVGTVMGILYDRPDVYTDYYEDGDWYGEYYRKIAFLGDTDNADLKNFIKSNAERLSGGYSLYTHENGQWVYKCEVV